MKMKLKTASALLLSFIMISGMVSGCKNTQKAEETTAKSGATTETAQETTEKKLVMYSSSGDEMINSVTSLFKEKYGIEVEVIQGGTGELLARLDAEKAKPYADVIFGGGESSFTEYRDVFDDYVSENDKDLLDDFKNTTGFCTNFVLDGSVLVVNKNLIGDIKIKGYNDLLNPKLKGKIASADPTSSSSALMQVENILTDFGGLDKEEGWEYIKKLLVNIDGKLQSGSGAVWKSVADGEMLVGLTYEEAALKLVKDGAPVEIVYPEEGTLFTAGTAGIIKNCPHPENAKLFIDFILSKEMQSVIGSQLGNRPVHKDAELSKNTLPTASIKTVVLDQAYINEHKKDVVDKFKEVFENSLSK
ncbi:MAG: ABC transporter substrate-binding protein [Bacillota bacterium]|nr:ABC transporter substrate-binding protein [Bacillota bacterium]